MKFSKLEWNEAKKLDEEVLIVQDADPTVYPQYKNLFWLRVFRMQFFLLIVAFWLPAEKKKSFNWSARLKKWVNNSPRKFAAPARVGNKYSYFP